MGGGGGGGGGGRASGAVAPDGRMGGKINIYVKKKTRFFYSTYFKLLRQVRGNSGNDLELIIFLGVTIMTTRPGHHCVFVFVHGLRRKYLPRT